MKIVMQVFMFKNLILWLQNNNSIIFKRLITKFNFKKIRAKITKIVSIKK